MSTVLSSILHGKAYEKPIKTNKFSSMYCKCNKAKVINSANNVRIGNRKVEKVFGSKWLITELNKLGFSISSNETTRYKQSVVCNENISDYLKDVMPGSFCQ